MKKRGKITFFVVFALIVLLAYTAIAGISTRYGDVENIIIKGVDSIRWGIDIRGGVDVTFTPPADVEATDDEMSAAESVIKQRLVSQNITDSEVYTDYQNYRIIVRFPWKEGESDFNPENAIKELGETAELTFREGNSTDGTGAPSGTTATNIILTGSDVKSAKAGQTSGQSGSSAQFVVQLELNDSGKEKFSEATAKLAPSNGIISIWLDDQMISYPNVKDHITDGIATISGNFDAESAKELADKINAGALPFALTADNYNTINPTLGLDAKDAMVLAGGIALLLVCLYMIIVYRLPGAVASIALVGQTAGAIAAISGYFAPFPSFTLTLPGIAGIVLAIGMGVDANVITAERIKEELRSGKSVNAALQSGYKRAFSAIFDGNITVIIVAIILMGAFGPPASMFATLLKPIFQFFPSAITGSIYSFGYTLLVGVIMNFVMGMGASRLMLKSVSKFKCFGSKWLYGGKKDEE